MEIKAYKNYSEIVNLLDSIKERLETEFENFQEEFTQKYNLEITPELMQALTEFIKLKLDFTFKNFCWLPLQLYAYRSYESLPLRKFRQPEPGV